MCIFERQIELASLIQYFAFSSHDSISNSKCISGKEKKTDPSIKCIGERDCIFDSPLSSEGKMHAHLHRLLEEESVMHSTAPKCIYMFAFSVEVSLRHAYCLLSYTNASGSYARFPTNPKHLGSILTSLLATTPRRQEVKHTLHLAFSSETHKHLAGFLDWS